jgi:hypothetical protein
MNHDIENVYRDLDRIEKKIDLILERLSQISAKIDKDKN